MPKTDPDRTPEQSVDATADEYSREDHRIFCERVLRDPESGKLCVMDPVHSLASEHVEEAWKGGYFAGVVMPRDHGKTLTGVIGRVLHVLGRDPSRRVKIICSAEDQAKKRLQTIGEYITGSTDFQRVFPGCVPAVSESRGSTSKWTGSRLILERDTPSPDDSLEAWGISSSGVGGRADYMFLDDPVDLKNALLQPSMRETVKEQYKNAWLPLLVPGGKLAYFATVWHEDDLTREQMKNSRFLWLVVRVSEDFDHLDCERFVGGSSNIQKFEIPLWSRYDKPQLLRKRQEIGERAFNRGYRQIPISDSDRYFPKFSTAIIANRSADDLAPATWPCIVGVDMSGKNRKGTVIFIGRVNPANQVKVPIAIWHGKWSGAEKARTFQSVYERYDPVAMYVENNAQQQDLLDVCMDDPKYTFSSVLHGHLTGANKFDPTIGLPSMDAEFERGSGTRGWLVPGLEFTGPAHDAGACGMCGFCRWVEEMSLYPYSVSNDAVMSSWIFREGVRKHFGSSGGLVNPSDIVGHGARRLDENGFPTVKFEKKYPDKLTGVVRW